MSTRTALAAELLRDEDPEMGALRTSVRRFVNEHLIPHELELESTETLEPEVWEEVVRRSRELGVWALNYPCDAGGPGMGAVAQAVVREELGRTTMGMSRVARRPPLALLRHSETARQVATEAVAGRADVAFAMTESGAGSSLRASRTRFDTHEGARWLSGEKHFVTGAPQATHLLVLAREGSGTTFTTALVPTDREGVQICARPKMGWHGWPWGDVTFDRVRVHDEEVLGAPGEGLTVAMSDIEATRLGVSAHYVGTTHRALELATATASTRQVAGGLLIHQQGFRWRVAALSARLLAAHELVLAGARAIDAGESGRTHHTSSLKWLASELAFEAADFALQTVGAAGYQDDSIENILFRDARAFRIGEGTSETQLETMSRLLMGAAR